MRVGLLVICALALLVVVSGSVLKCTKCKKNECECKRKVLKASTLAPHPFSKTKVCEESYPTDLHPVKDLCSCTDVAHVRPGRPQEETPKFAHSTSCECGYESDEERKPEPKKYSADAVSQHLANQAAYKKHVSVSETDLHFHGNALRVSPNEKRTPDVREERLHKYNRALIELKPPKRKRVYKQESSEEEEFPCHPEKQSYSEICYGNVKHSTPKFKKVDEDRSVCDRCEDTYSKESYEASKESKQTYEKKSFYEKEKKHVSYEKEEESDEKESESYEKKKSEEEYKEKYEKEEEEEEESDDEEEEEEEEEEEKEVYTTKKPQYKAKQSKPKPTKKYEESEDESEDSDDSAKEEESEEYEEKEKEKEKEKDCDTKKPYKKPGRKMRQVEQNLSSEILKKIMQWHRK